MAQWYSGIVHFAGWRQKGSTRKFIVEVELPDGAPPWPASVIWNRELILIARRKDIEETTP